MRKTTDSFNNFAARRRNDSFRKANPLNIFGSTAVALVVLGSAWTVYDNVLGASIYPAVSASGVEPGANAPLQASVKPKNTLALLTAAYPTEMTFAERLSGLDRESVASSDPGIRGNIQANIDLDIPAVAAKPQDAPPPIRSVVAVPVPLRRSIEPRVAQTKNSSTGDLNQRAKATVAASTGSVGPTIFERLFGKPPSTPPSNGPSLAYASADTVIQSDARDSGDIPAPPYDRMTAVYDISAHTVYMPDGTKLEAHSGLGSMLDDPRHVRERMRGPTPPHIYDLALRESLFHGVPALRLKPVGGDEAIFGRSGLLAHTYMLGPNGDSNGCVSFRDYNAFLQAYREQRVKRLVVVAHLG